ncbi:TonB-dependent receptor [Xylella fastidiosa]|uniref:TonB-dependent receptor n=1 Tax=Xylella fastidiosa TaxID=2371 RepID=UPI0003F9037B|nr:TonB-dependent receptor [Xylella fastidiosa]KFA41273.1 TonB-dependent receptor [Xylella fastidiosa]MCO5545968.1 TonB-dependent receptor [Xylella fastidiosa]MDC7969848.1 TonB-dependent receptor [Xylella fastidiosa subsp. multiplex]MDD0908610.1 TonB-dependent receptor [Xylella fastidiosa subsp. multiplex]MDS9990010.1 TonB-dependent receptor [Xylella fastidiosa]
MTHVAIDSHRYIPRNLLCASISGVLLVAAVSVQAQETNAASNLERITVTGSNIPRTDTETASPVQIVTREDIARSGRATVGEYLQTLTSDGQGSIPKNFGNGFAMGGSGISLRGLGAGSTLVLINGRRIASYGLADDGQKLFADLSSIPMDAVERVEVLKDGASSIYGSDAIAGVVNIILRNDFQGALVSASYGLSGYRDGHTPKATMTAGVGNLASDGWNALVSVDVGKSDGIMTSDRKDRKWIGTGDTRPWGYDLANSQQFLRGAIAGKGTIADSSPVGAVRNPSNSQFSSLPGCSKFSSISPQDPGGGCLWDVAQFRSLTPDEKYANVFTRGTFTLFDTTELYTELSYSKKKSEFSNLPSAVSGAWGYPGGAVNASSGDGATVLAPGHPDNPYNVPVRLRYAAFDVGPRVKENTNDFMRVVLGIKGSVASWDYDVSALHSQSQMDRKFTGYLRYSSVRCVLGNLACPAGVWNIGNGSETNPRSLYDFISPVLSAQAKTKLDVFDARVSRALADLSGGAMGLAMGVEYRRDQASLTPMTYTDIGDIIGAGYSAYSGEEKVSAAYAELAAPFTKAFEATVAGRVDHYSSGNTAITPKLGVKWKPFDWFALRGTYAQGFRAPNAAESGKGGLASFASITDPVRCAAAGGSGAECAPRLVSVITSPNPDLKPEKSNSYTLGMVFQPTSSTSMTVDGWQIKRTKEIAQIGTVDAINAGDVIRDDNLLKGVAGTGQLLGVKAKYVNLNATTARGVDTDVQQRIAMGGLGDLILDLQWSRMLKFQREDANGNISEYAGTHGNCDVSNCIGTPKDRINFGATWKLNNISVSALGHYRSPMENRLFKGGACVSHFADGSDAPIDCRLNAFTSVDLSANWQATEALAVFGSVQNLFDRIAPLDPLTGGALNYNPLDSAGAVGRFFTVGARYAFK